MRYQKVVTTVFTNGTTSTEKRDTVHEYDLHQDHAEEHARLSDIARSGPVGRIQTVEDTTDALIVIYNTGLTKVFNWVAVPE
jgi:hypothetical protein